VSQGLFKRVNMRIKNGVNLDLELGVAYIGFVYLSIEVDYEN